MIFKTKIMKEIIFRGKTNKTLVNGKPSYTNKGAWVKGSLNISCDGTICTISDRQSVYTVRKETVGQYIGIKDSCGDSIFEGDVLLLDGGVGFVIWDNHGIGWALESPGSCAVDYPRKDDYERSKIIGNIHDDENIIK